MTGRRAVMASPSDLSAGGTLETVDSYTPTWMPVVNPRMMHQMIRCVFVPVLSAVAVAWHATL